LSVPSKKLWMLLGLAVFCWWIRYHPPGTEILVLDDDARQHAYWTARFRSPELFQDDLPTRYVSSHAINPVGYQWVYRLGTRFLDPLPLSRLLSLVLLLGSLVILLRLTRRMGMASQGRGFCALLFLFFFLYGHSGGIPRTFAYPLFLLFLLHREAGRHRWAAWTLIFQAVIYPPIVPNTVALAGCSVVSRFVHRKARPLWFRDVVPLIFGVAAAALILGFVYSSADRELLGPQVTLDQARSMEEFGENGRNEFFRDSPISYLLTGRSGIGLYHSLGFVVILGGMGAVIGFRKLRVRALAIHLIWTSLLLFGLAHLVLFRMYLPSRYTLLTLPLALLLTIGDNTAPFVERVRPWLRSVHGILCPDRGGKWMGGALLLAFAAGYAYVQGHAIVHVDTEVAVIDRLDREMLDFLNSMPPTVLVAGHPEDMDNVPMVSRRKVLVNQETSLAYHTEYYRRIRERLDDWFQVYYAERWTTVREFALKHGVDVIVVRKEHFTRKFLDGRIYHEPFNRFVKERVRRNQPFALLSAPKTVRCFDNERYLILCLKD